MFPIEINWMKPQIGDEIDGYCTDNNSKHCIIHYKLGKNALLPIEFFSTCYNDYKYVGKGLIGKHFKCRIMGINEENIFIVSNRYTDYFNKFITPKSNNIYTHTHWAFRTLRVLSALINEEDK